MKVYRLYLTCLFPLLILSGCLESQDRFIINPDGSGKVEHQAVFQIMNLNLGMGGGQDDPERNARRAVKTLLNESEGVDVWSDVSYELTPDGRVSFSGTAYFRDVSALEFKHGGISMEVVKPSFENKGGSAELVLDWDGESTEEEVAPSDDEPITPEKLAAERGKFQQMKPMMAAMIGGLSIQQTYVLPGTIDTVSNLNKESENEVSLAFSGEKMLGLLDQVVMDDAWLKAQLQSGKQMGQEFKPDNTLNKGLFGEEGPIQATVTGSLKSQFDYEAEVEAARSALPDMLAELGIQGPAVTRAVGPPAAGSEFTTLELGGVRWVGESEYDEARPFNWNPGVTLALMGTFPGSVLDVSEILVEKIETTSGESLLPESEFERKITFNSLSNDGTTVVFEVKCKMPETGADGIREVSGQVTYQTSESVKEVDLGLTSLAKDASGSALEAVIRRRDEQQWGNSTRYTLTLDLEIAQSIVKEVQFFGADGQRLDLDSSGYSASSDSVSLNFASESPIPEAGSAKAVLHDNLQSYTIPFKLTDRSWFGEPL